MKQKLKNNQNQKNLIKATTFKTQHIFFGNTYLPRWDFFCLLLRLDVKHTLENGHWIEITLYILNFEISEKYLKKIGTQVIHFFIDRKQDIRILSLVSVFL